MRAPRPMPARGETAVIGLGKSGVAAVTLLRKHGYSVYASDVSTSESVRKAAKILQFLGAECSVGEHDVRRITRSAMVVASPGIPPDAPPLAAARAGGIEVLSEVELALRCMPPVPYVAVTGTNGKTTTTALTARLLRAVGYAAVEAGNIGTPLTEVALREPLPEWIALELSSFQLHDTPSVDPAAGILTNLAPDHLDRYSSVEEYYADKARLFANASPTSRWVINADDPASLRMTEAVAGTRLYFAVAPDASAGARCPQGFYDRDADVLHVLGEPLLPRQELPLLGDHNVANALAAALAVMAVSPTHRNAQARNSIAAALRSFRAPPHRLELVGEWHGVQWINDSKATNVSSARVAVNGMTRPTVLLLGGRHKGEPYTTLTEPVRAHVKRVIAYGESAGLIERDLSDDVVVDRLGSDFAAVIAHAREVAQPGDVVLLSPACSSYDMFENYEERGARFRELVRASA